MVSETIVAYAHTCNRSLCGVPEAQGHGERVAYRSIPKRSSLRPTGLGFRVLAWFIRNPGLKVARFRVVQRELPE